MTSALTPAEPQPTAQLPPMTTEERQQLVLDDQAWTDTRAKDITVADAKRAMTHRHQNYDRSFRRSDEVLMGCSPRKKTWEGTRNPRASLPEWLAVQQIEALLPHRVGALFADDYPFECMPQPGTTMDNARMVRDLVRSQIDNLNPDVMGMTLREIMRRSIKSSLTYGAGPIEFGWEMRERKELRAQRVQYQRTIQIPHPVTGQMIPIPTGEFAYKVLREVKTYNISQPKVQNVDVREFYIDPNCPSPNPQEAQFALTHQRLPISLLKQICIPELGFKLPEDDKKWLELANSKSSSLADISKSWGEVSRGNYYNPVTDQSTDPAQARIDVIRYWQRGRHTWMFGWDWLAYNEPNELGVIPFLNAPYVDVIGRFYNISLCDLVEGDAKFVQQIREARADELSLMIHAPLIFPMGGKTAQSQRKLGPGRVWEVDDMKNIPQRMEMGNVTQGAWMEIPAAEQRVQKTTGVTDLAALGAPATGGNSANRTATGVNTQTAATGTRIQYQVENDEDQVMVPLLQMLLLLNQKNLDPEQAVLIAGKEGQVHSIDPVDILNSKVKFKMRAADKLRMRRMAGQGLEGLLQFLSGTQSQMMQQGMTANWKLVGQIVSDVYGIPSSDLFMPMTPEQQQAMQQQMMAPLLAKEKMQNDRLQAHADVQEDKSESEMLKIILRHPDVIKLLLSSLGVKQSGEAHAPSESISFKDLPPSGKAQMALQAGIDITAAEAAKQDKLSKPQPKLSAGDK